MYPPTTNARRDDEEIRGWIAEAGDCRVETRPEHMEHVRHLLLERVALPQVAIIPPEEVETPLGVGLIRLFALAGLVAAVLFGAVYLASRPADGWARVAQTLHEKTWIHILSFGPDGPVEESWISPRFEILARKHYRGAERPDAEFHDVAIGTKDEYLAEENTIYRDLEDKGRQKGRRKRQAQDIEVFHQLLLLDALKLSPLPETEIIAERQREAIGQGKTWKLHELTIRRTFGQKSNIKMTIWVNPNTGLPRSWEIVVDGETLQQFLDYPTKGPADIRSLGVPATAKRENQLSLSEDSLDMTLSQVLTGLKVGRSRFDDYCGYVWNASVTPANLRRIWRKGRKWRIDHVLPRSTTRDAILDHDRIPIDIDLAGMQAREADSIFEPEAICDGVTVKFYNYQPKATVPDQPNVSKQKSVTVQQTYGLPDESNMPWPDLMPELIGRPNVEETAQFWAHFLDLKPGDGPPGTLRLQVRDSQYLDPKQPDRYRLWIDPEKNYLSLRSEISMFEPVARSTNHATPAKTPARPTVIRTRPVNGRATRLAYVETKILTDLARSPNGFWYPTRVLRKTSNSKVDQVTRFLLDFDEPIPDELFQSVD